jgi:hypothetical protein
MADVPVAAMSAIAPNPTTANPNFRISFTYSSTNMTPETEGLLQLPIAKPVPVQEHDRAGPEIRYF